MNSRQPKSTVDKNIPPRKFPKQQYRKLTRHFWTIAVIIIAVICVVGGIFWINAKPKRSSHQTARPARTEKPAKRTHQTSHKPAQAKAKPLSTKQGEKLLGHWLIKLHYPTAKNRVVLERYQKNNPQQDAQITKRLSQLAHSKTSSANRQNRIRQFIDHQFK